MYGRCYDGHIHLIRQEYEDIAVGNKQKFKSFMFHQAIIKATDSENFKPLPARNCPLSFFFKYQTNLLKPKPNDRDRKSKSVYEIKPYEGDTDPRTASQFLHSFENHPDRQGDVSIRASKQKLFYLIKSAMDLKYEDIAAMRYEDVREEFLNKFWNLQQQYAVYSSFLKSSYPLYEDQKVSAYVNVWINRFKNYTILLSSDFIDSLINRIPAKYGVFILRKTRPGKSIDVEQVYDLVKACESDLSLVERKNDMMYF